MTNTTQTTSASAASYQLTADLIEACARRLEEHCATRPYTICMHQVVERQVAAAETGSRTGPWPRAAAARRRKRATSYLRWTRRLGRTWHGLQVHVIGHDVT